MLETLLPARISGSLVARGDSRVSNRDAAGSLNAVMGSVKGGGLRLDFEALPV